MSCNYAEGLSPYEHKGLLGQPESFDSPEKLEKKCILLAQMIEASAHVVVHTGAGISTSAGIPDFRGPNGVWTLELEGKKPTTNISFADARPTRTHMILKKLVECGRVQYVVSQNIDGLHLKSGLPRERLAELHGNMFVDECNVCSRQFIRSEPVETVGKRTSGKACMVGRVSGRPCRGRLHDGVLDWEHSLPENDLCMAEWHSSVADLSICLGTTLQIVPSGNLPLETLKYGGKLVAVNLQPTKHDNKMDLKINYYVDDVLERVMKYFNIDIPEYDKNDDPTVLAKAAILEWAIERSLVNKMEKVYKSKCKGVKKKRLLVKRKSRGSDDDEKTIIKKEKQDRSLAKKELIKKEILSNNGVVKISVIEKPKIEVNEVVTPKVIEEVKLENEEQLSNDVKKIHSNKIVDVADNEESSLIPKEERTNTTEKI